MASCIFVVIKIILYIKELIMEHNETNEPEKCHQALSTIKCGFLGPAWLRRPGNAAPNYDDPIILDKHPFDADIDEGVLVSFVGFSSDSLYSLVYHALGEDVLTELVLWACPQKENPTKQHQVFVDIRSESQCWLASGYTDYSGSGRDALIKAINLFELLSYMYKIDIGGVICPLGADNKAWDYINEVCRKSQSHVEPQ